MIQEIGVGLLLIISLYFLVKKFFVSGDKTPEACANCGLGKTSEITTSSDISPELGRKNA